MHNYTPARAIPASTEPAATAALKRLSDISIQLGDELEALPSVNQPLLDALSSQDKDQIDQELDNLQQQLDDYWRAPSATGQSRRALFSQQLKQALQDEAVLKSHENDLEPGAAQLAATSDTGVGPDSIISHSLHVKLNARTRVEIRGALVLSVGAERTLLALPGSGLSTFATQQTLLAAVAQWLNDKTLRWALLMNADQRHQDAVLAVANDAQLSMDTFDKADVQLVPISKDPYKYALKSQFAKQREDLIYACEQSTKADQAALTQRIEKAMHMPGLFGPATMLQRREQALGELAFRKQLPYWIKRASAQDVREYLSRVARYDQARLALSSVLNGAESADRYAQVSLRTRLADDLGYDLDPAAVVLQTQRNLPHGNDSYTLTRTLPELALYGLHPNDERQGSDFQTRTTINIDGQSPTSAHASLTPSYIGELIARLQLRTAFAQHQRDTYTNADNQTLMHNLLDLQIAESVCSAKLQAHLSNDDYDIVEAIRASKSAPAGKTLSVQRIRLDGTSNMDRMVVFRQESAQGQLDRLILFTADAPRDQQFMAFHNENQLLQEVVAWTSDSEMNDYLIQQAAIGERTSLKATLRSLGQKPTPSPGFMQLVTLNDYSTALRKLTDENIATTLAEHALHTPGWYRQASEPNRQKLTALEDAARGAMDHDTAAKHPQVEAFEAYVHRRASEKINRLLGTAADPVDPDQIIVTSEKETLTYTQMLRNGYDDSIDLMNASADTVATFTGPHGVNLSALTPGKVAASVRGTWLADDYAALVKSTLLDAGSPAYSQRRDAAARITQLHMQAAALRSLLKGHIDADQYHWLEQSIDNVHISDAQTRRRYPVYPLQIHVDKPFIASHLNLIDQLVIPSTHLTHIETVQGCLAFLPTHLRQAALLYTPTAPDGIEFRGFGTFVESLDEPGMVDYYKDRCRIKARRILSFFLNDMKQGNANKAPFLPKDSIADFAQICFNRVIERKLRDVEETTTGRHDMLSQLIWTSIDIIATVVTLPFPPASFAVGVALSLRDNVQAIQALAGDTPQEANGLILASVLNIAGAAGDLTVGLKGFGGAVRRLAKDSKIAAPPAALKQTSDLPSHASLPSYDELFPVDVHNQPFLLARPNANHQAAVFRNVGSDVVDINPTRHFAIRSDTGSWHPLGQPANTHAPTSNRVSADRAVNIPRSELVPLAQAHARGVSQYRGKCYIQMNDLIHQVHYDAAVRSWYIVDPANPFAFFGRQPVRLDDQYQWRLVNRTGLRGGGNDAPGGYRPLAEESTATDAVAKTHHDYEMPKNLQPHLENILQTAEVEPAGYGAGLEELFEAYHAQVRQTYTNLRESLYLDANAFFAGTPTLPLRPSLPDVDTSVSVGNFLNDVFSHSNGLVLSEAPKSIASKRFLMLHMQHLVEQRVEVLYLPHLFTDKHLKKLAKYRAKGAKVRAGSHEIKHHLDAINGGALNNLSPDFDYYHLIKEAHRHNIEVRPLSASTSYDVQLHPVASASADDAAAQKMSNLFAHKIISEDVANAPSRRWIALVDQNQATTHEGVAGIAELQGAISGHIEDIPAGGATRITRQASLVDTEAANSLCDFNIEFAQTYLANPPATPKTPRTPVSPSSPDPVLPGTSTSTAVDSGTTAEAGFHWNEKSGWLRASADQIAPHPPTALQRSLADPTYELPLASRDALYQMAYFERKGMDTHYLYFDEKLMKVQREFMELRDKLVRDAKKVLDAELPTRPVMPALDPQLTPATFIERLYEQTDGMVVGELHDSIVSKQFIIDNLPLLSQQKVKTLYLEHLLTDLHQADLDRFAETGIMSQRLKHSLEVLDYGHGTDPAGVYTFEKLVLRARNQGIEVRAIDCASSYHLKGTRERSTTRQQVMNYFASRTIRRHQAIMGKHRWVALVGNSHSNTFVQSVPGLAELEGGIGLRVVDGLPGSGQKISLDPGENVRLPLRNREVFIKGDFRIEMQIQASPISIRPPQPLPLDQRLSRPGMFLAEYSEGSYMIVHRSRDGAIHRTPVQVNAAGKVYLERPTWKDVHRQPYDDVDALILALEEINLTRVG